MIYCCEGCGFLFRRIGEVKTCPICESSRYRLATEAEAERLKTLLKQENMKGMV